ncbi:MAG: hypothetical protein OEZ14_05590, partial [Acidimicrobiia bacterium]|nr:hypothetical protein [Acidimicrobiia bacterium]
MRNKLFSTQVLSTASLAALILGGLAPAVSAQSPMPEPGQLAIIPPVTIPEPDPVPDPKPGLPLG